MWGCEAGWASKGLGGWVQLAGGATGAAWCMRGMGRSMFRYQWTKRNNLNQLKAWHKHQINHHHAFKMLSVLYWFCVGPDGPVFYQYAEQTLCDNITSVILSNEWKQSANVEEHKVNNTKQNAACPAGCVLAGLDFRLCATKYPNPSTLRLQRPAKRTRSLTDFPPTNTDHHPIHTFYLNWLNLNWSQLDFSTKHKIKDINCNKWFLPCGESGLVFFTSLL